MNVIKKSINEKTIVFLISLLIVLSTNIPVIAGWLMTPPGKTFLGQQSISSGDTYSYLAWIDQARQGHIFFKNLFTAEPQPRIYTHPLFLTMGLIARYSKLPNLILYHLVRNILGIIFLTILYKFISLYFFSTKERIIAFLIVTVSSGLGWISHPLSIDNWIIEAIIYLNLLFSPLNVTALSLIVGIFICLYQFTEAQNNKNLLIGAFLSLLLTWIHPYDFIIIITVTFAFLLLHVLESKNFKAVFLFLGAIIVGALPSIIYNSWVVENNIAFFTWSFRTNAPSFFPISFYISGFGFLGIFAFLAFAALQTKYKNKSLLLLYAWIMGAGVLIYLPLLYRFQRKFSEGLSIPIAILATMGILWLWRKPAKKSIPVPLRVGLWAIIILIAFSLPLSNIRVVLGAVDLYQAAQRPWYITKDEYHAMHDIKKITSENDIILTTSEIGNMLPGISGRTVILGHGDQTMNGEGKLLWLTSSLKKQEAFHRFLKLNKVNFIFVNPDMRQQALFSFESVDYLQERYRNTAVTIYEFKN